MGSIIQKNGQKFSPLSALLKFLSVRTKVLPQHVKAPTELKPPNPAHAQSTRTGVLNEAISKPMYMLGFLLDYSYINS